MKRKLLPLVLAVAWGVSSASWAGVEEIGEANSVDGYHVTFYKDTERNKIWADISRSGYTYRGLNVIMDSDHINADDLEQIIHDEEKVVRTKEVKNSLVVHIQLGSQDDTSVSQNWVWRTVSKWLVSNEESDSGSKRKSHTN